ncbi:pol polyprotein [Trichonephila clavipes]|uniref:Pol polyprotein n=1 Tax=Trichonephila clavipes TaxID=2585209 RepID=A0A8X6SWK2_TRICX|nr:pol polyprotein [Trichonephila clavipes]
MVLLGIRSSFKQDLEASSAELVYGTTLKLPGEFFVNTLATTSTTSFLQCLRQHVRSFRLVPVKHHGSNPVFISKDLLQASHVFLRIDRVLSRTDKVFKLEINGKAVSVSIDRLKAAHSYSDCESTSPIPTSKSPKDVITRSGRRSQRVVRFQMPSSV